MNVIRDDQRQCPTCRGTGINPVQKSLVCPKCNGERVVSKEVRL